jgi:hypothetical protein
MYDNLPAIHKDKQVFRKLVSCHGFKQDEIFLLTDPKVNECNSITVKLNRLFKKNPDQIILAFSCYAGHGMIQDGRQVFLVNEFASFRGFYKIVGVEENMRLSATFNSNAYIVVIFACCREIFLVAQHCGGISLKQVNEIKLAQRVKA